MVVVDGRIGQPLLQLDVGALELVDELVERCHAWRVAAPVRPGAPVDAAGRSGLGQLGVERHLGDAGERLRDRAVLLCPLGGLAEPGLVEAGDVAADGDAPAMSPSPGWNVTVTVW